jgi:hypothetical protein
MNMARQFQRSREVEKRDRAKLRKELAPARRELKRQLQKPRSPKELKKLLGDAMLTERPDPML